MTLPRNNDLLPYARRLRKEMTKEERHLWYDFLKSYPVKFYKQKIVGNYILDFYCEKAKLAIELDGSQHYEQDGQNYDLQRTAYLNGLGIEVLRFSNADIHKNFRGVCELIRENIYYAESTSSHLSVALEGDSSPQGEPAETTQVRETL